ncbi:MarR family winged helix-turn-helix transcriptional regulator [Tersicoccus phoenicis]|uniref:MarR family winged helix-turn-helix transcriptional regulator n=1 Tax=Tersicoccus phoenicis TaxID=554083 RepID=UPI000A06F6FE|nr:MarR family transcriptional regulator [Tersicoccus phoenicis]
MVESGEPRGSARGCPDADHEDADQLALADDLRQGLRHAVYLMRGLDADGDWSTAQVGLLNMLAESPLRISGIAARSGIRVPSATDLVNRLEKAGLVQRFPDPYDARAVLVRLTAHGRQTLGGVNARRNSYLARRLAQLDADERQALRRAVPVLERLVALQDDSR